MKLLKLNNFTLIYFHNQSIYKHDFSVYYSVYSGSTSERINLSPFTKDFRGVEQYNESLRICGTRL
jgi:hypothetical protein